MLLTLKMKKLLNVHIKLNVFRRTTTRLLTHKVESPLKYTIDDLKECKGDIKDNDEAGYNETETDLNKKHSNKYFKSKRNRRFSHLSQYRKITFEDSQTIEEKKALIEQQINLLKEHEGDSLNLPDTTKLNERKWELLMNEPHRFLKNVLYLGRKQFYKAKKVYDPRIQEEKKQKILSGDKAITNYPGHKTFMRYNQHKSAELLRNYAFASFRIDNPKLVFDFQFEDHIKVDQQLSTLTLQMGNTYSANIVSKDPFQFYYCNLREKGVFNQNFIKRSFGLDRQVVVTTEKSYLDLFPKKDLVYLSPDASSEMVDFDDRKIYIIGAIVDYEDSSSSKRTLQQAKFEGIRHERLPLDSVLGSMWAAGQKKLLSLDNLVKSLLEYRTTRNWFQAFSVLPKRKIRDTHESFGAGKGLS